MEIQVGQTTLFYKKSGSGAPVLLLHGNGEDHHIFDPLASRLAQNYTVYAIDSRCHGRSGKTQTLSYESMMGDIYDLICMLQLAPVNIVGFSDGAIVSLLLAMAHKGLIHKMALLGINLKPEDFTQESYAYVKSMYEETGDALFRLMLEEPNIELDAVRDVSTPALIVAGEHDIFKPETFARLRDAMPNATLKILQGHEHDSYITQNDMLHADLHAFFAE